jgi:hypothetical protein
MSDVGKHPGAVWFRPKRYGYGATPVTWQGWALVGGFVAAIVLAAILLVGKSNPPPGNVVAFFIVEAALLAALWVISQRTTDGAWRWRWGADKNSGSMDS